MPRIKCEVWQTPGGVVTVTTDNRDGSGMRLCGIKLTGSGSRFIAEFYLDDEAVAALSEDMARLTDDEDDG